jgi:hypothetical protein
MIFGTHSAACVSPPKKQTKAGGRGTGLVKPQADPDSKPVVSEAQIKGQKAGIVFLDR